jgi:hypothetical protein
MTHQLQRYFEIAANMCFLSRLVILNRNFLASSTSQLPCPNFYIGDLPPELEAAPQLQLSIEAYNRAETSNGGQ